MAYAEQVSVLGVIKNILHNYPFSVGVYRELLQNTDDARAQEQVRPLSHLVKQRLTLRTDFHPGLSLAFVVQWRRQ